ncbi:branched-chain amino acid transport system ATP-binding protein [Palleronia aestuarii]|uniref:Branched-chain amino acid transport system ATP-binding protein n=1 Tax=Palleronia aestuarii TaxID=568105 RepID=A0A2W7MY64_9RHOB|nr:ABC transporter ATP-binding protein [Palleronia aestuarii]PZX13035.1 branched-chain amino acid transport system ATP-binding protein [Palleronia aestuarii]
MSIGLAIENLHAGYGPATVLEDVSLTVNAGDIVAIVGANGAGKSTLLNTIAGLVPASSGRMRFGDTDIAATRADALPRKGLVLVPEGGRLFPFMTVRENLEVGGFSRRKSADFSTWLDEVMDLFPILRERQGQLAGSLSGGERQMCAIARAVMSQPDLIMLDEPSVGLSPKLAHEVLGLVQTLRDTKDVTVILVEQNVGEALAVSDQAHVLDHGRIVRSGPAAELADDPAIQKAYMGL